MARLPCPSKPVPDFLLRFQITDHLRQAFKHRFRQPPNLLIGLAEVGNHDRAELPSGRRPDAVEGILNGESPLRGSADLLTGQQKNVRRGLDLCIKMCHAFYGRKRVNLLSEP